MTNQTITPVVLTSRLGFIDQKVELNKLKAESRKVIDKTGAEVNRTMLNGYTDQPLTSAFNGVIGFQTVSIDRWLKLPPYKANRPWEERYKLKPHLRGMLESPLQTLGFALVDEKGELLCRLDGNGRAGAWLDGALEKPEFVSVLTFILPKELTEGAHVVSSLFSVLNSEEQKISSDHKRLIAQRRLVIDGLWVEFESRFVQEVKATAFQDIKTYLKQPAVAKPTPADYLVANKEVVFLVDQLGINTGRVMADDANAYLSTTFTMMMKTMLNPEQAEDNQRQKKAFLFWQQWGKADASPIVKDLFQFVIDSDQSGSGAKKKLREHIEAQFELWRDDNTVPAGFELPSFAKWDKEKKEQAAQALRDEEEARAQQQEEEEAHREEEVEFFNPTQQSPSLVEVDTSEGETEDNAPEGSDEMGEEEAEEQAQA